MEEKNSNSLSEEDHSLSSFVLQSYSIDGKSNEKNQYQLNAPLCISQTYEEDFFDYFHLNYYGEDDHQHLFIASIRTIPKKTHEKSSWKIIDEEEEDHQLIRALIRTETNNYDIAEILNVNSEENILHKIFSAAELRPIHHYEIIHHIKANEKILEFDKTNDEQHSNKVAILFQNANQFNENEILSNDQMSTQMENFLNLISERVLLKDFSKYRGDLDTKTDQHGTHSYFTIFENHQLMFNIAPIIPNDKSDQQFIQRKSLIGNSLLTLVFQEDSNLIFQPNEFLGKVTQVYIIIQPQQINDELHYKIEIWRRGDIQSLNDQPVGIFKHDQFFRKYLLTLILNTMNIILKKDCFYSRIIQQRQRMKNEYFKKLIHFFDSYSKSNFISFDQKDLLIDPSTPLLSPSIDPIRLHSIKSHRLSFIPKIFGAITNNRTSKVNNLDNDLSPTNKTNNSNTLSVRRSSYQQDLSDRTTEGISSLITSIHTFPPTNDRISLSQSTMNKINIEQPLIVDEHYDKF